MLNTDLLLGCEENKIIGRSGRKFWRHPSGMGTVMEFNDGLPRKVLVLDAAYRKQLRFGTAGLEAPLHQYAAKDDNGALNKYCNQLRYSCGTYDAYLDGIAAVSDAWLNAEVSLTDQNTARQNCDVWITFKDKKDVNGRAGVPALEHCRAILVGGRGCDVPNIQTLTRIYCEAKMLDGLDPTAASADVANRLCYASRDANLCGFFSRWSSTCCNAYTCWTMTALGNLSVKVLYGDSQGSRADNKSVAMGVIPVLEL